jgi:paraquat-inducible protein A
LIESATVQRTGDAPIRNSLRAVHPRLWAIPALLVLTVALLVIGQVLEGVTIDSLGHEPDRYSVFGGVADLWRTGNRILAIVLFSFSIVFPTVKCCALAWMWFLPMEAGRRANLAHWLKPLGKWSMLDGFVVIALVGSVQLSGPLVDLATATPLLAVYPFAFAILLSIVLSFWLGRLSDDEAGDAHYIPQPDLSLTLAPWGAAGCLLMGWTQPIMRLEKTVFSHTYDLPTASAELLAAGYYVLLVMFLLFCLVLPMIYFVGLGLVAWLQGRGRKLERALSLLVAMERWAMLDVFFLGVLLVYFKVGGFVSVQVLSGFWLISASAALSVYCAFRVRRVY